MQCVIYFPFIYCAVDFYWIHDICDALRVKGVLKYSEMSADVTMRDYLPLYHKQKGFSIRIPFGKFAWFTVSLPLGSFIFCIIWSILFHLQRSTYTHCQVTNVFPSISAAIGMNSPQRYVWKTAIAVHAFPRFVVAWMYLKHNHSKLQPGAYCISKWIFVLNIIENIALVGLTFISSSDNYDIHEKCFVTFMITSELYMLLTCYSMKKKRRILADNVEAKSLRVKFKLFGINVISFASAAYFFYRHNSFCEPYIYSIFALCEYVVVLTNMAFHMTAYWDFHDRSLVVASDGVHYIHN